MEILTKEIIEVAYEIYKQSKSIEETTQLINGKFNLNVCSEAIRKKLKGMNFKLRSSKEGITLSHRNKLTS